MYDVDIQTERDITKYVHLHLYIQKYSYLLWSCCTDTSLHSSSHIEISLDIIRGSTKWFAWGTTQIRRNTFIPLPREPFSYRPPIVFEYLLSLYTICYTLRTIYHNIAFCYCNCYRFQLCLSDDQVLNMANIGTNPSPDSCTAALRLLKELVSADGTVQLLTSFIATQEAQRSTIECFPWYQFPARICCYILAGLGPICYAASDSYWFVTVQPTCELSILDVFLFLTARAPNTAVRMCIGEIQMHTCRDAWECIRMHVGCRMYTDALMCLMDTYVDSTWTWHVLRLFLYLHKCI